MKRLCAEAIPAEPNPKRAKAAEPKQGRRKAELPKGFYVVHKIKDMAVENGARWWLVAWAGADEDGEPWEDSWEPTRSLTPDLCVEFLFDRRAREMRTISVDTRPLDSLVQRTVSRAVMTENRATFGHKHIIVIEALTLRDLAVHYFESLVSSMDLERKSSFDPKKKLTTLETFIKDQATVASFCKFQTFMPEKSGIGSMRFKLGRRSNIDAVKVATLLFRIKDNAHTPGCVVFEVEVVTVKMNGKTGELTPPHQVTGWLKKNANLVKVYDHARTTLPHARMTSLSGAGTSSQARIPSHHHRGLEWLFCM